jgi:hypothetical protein
MLTGVFFVCFFQCNDVFTNQYCPRGPFCAFAHADHEMAIDRNLPTDTNFADILSNVLPSTGSSLNSSGSGLSIGMIGPVGSKPGETNNNNHNHSSSLSTTNGNGTSSSINMLSNNNPSSIAATTNGVMDGLGIFSLGSSSGMDLSDVLRHPSASPLDHLQGNNGGGGFFGGTNHSSSSSSANTVAAGGNGGMFGAQSFASAVGGGTGGTDRSSSANSTTSRGSKFFEDQPKNIGGGDGLKGHNFYETFDNIYGFGGGGGGDEQRDAYSLFPSMSLSKVKVVFLMR